MYNKFDRLNREPREHNNRNVDRFNTSTKSNYTYFDPCKLNSYTFKQNNGQYTDRYSHR